MPHSKQDSSTIKGVVSPYPLHCCNKVSEHGVESKITLYPETVSDKGFTLIEVIAILLLMGILSAIAVTRSSNFGADTDVRGATEVVKNHLRYAQTKAMNSNVSWGLNFSGSTYTLRDANNVSASLPGDLPQGMAFASTVNPLMFENRWGSPGNTTITVTVSKGGSSQTITVTKNTGFIP